MLKTQCSPQTMAALKENTNSADKPKTILFHIWVWNATTSWEQALLERHLKSASKSNTETNGLFCYYKWKYSWQFYSSTETEVARHHHSPTLIRECVEVTKQNRITEL